MKLYRTMSESLAMCDLARAKRTEPTLRQQQRARKHWDAPGVLVRLARIVKGRRSIWHATKKDELIVLSETIELLSK